MKTLWCMLVGLCLCLPIVYAQSYEYMYKNQPANDSPARNTTHYQPQNIHAADSADTSRVIGFAIAPLYRKQPESPLGNFMADCMKLYAGKIYDTNIDAAFVNFSGIRSYIPKGDITIGTLYKVMPYDNKIVVLTLKGNVLKQFLDHQASLGGWPCAGVSMSIKNNSATDVLVNNQPLDDAKNYTIAVADYIANGGNQCTMLKGVSQLNKNYLFRTALIDYVTSFTKAGKPVTISIENRVVYRNE